MAKGEKKPIGKIALIALVVLIVIGVAGSMGAGTSSGDAATGQSTEQNQQEKPEPYTVSEEELDTSNQFAVTIKGTLTNNTESEKSYIQVSYNLYDADGAQVGTALANTNNLKAGGTWKFEALGTAEPSEVASWELIEVSGF